MANTKSAKKNMRQNERRRLVNAARRSEIKTTIKKAVVAVDQGAKSEALLLQTTAQSLLARGKSKGVIHPNTAARKTSRLAKRVAKNQPA